MAIQADRGRERAGRWLAMKWPMLSLLLMGCLDYATLQSNECYHGTCKDGLVCVAGFCELPINVDLTMAPVDDAGKPLDLTTPDLSPPSDMRVNMDPFLPPSMQPGCAPGHLGYALGPAYGCLSNSTGFLADSCNAATGWVPCLTDPIDRAVCGDLPWAFFASYSHGHQSTPNPDVSMSCTWTGAPQTDQRFIYGCGTSSTVHPTFNDFAKECGGFSRILACKSLSGQPDTTIYCPMGSPGSELDLTAIRTTDPMDGTMCCRG